MELVAGLSLKNLQPRVWDPDSPFHLPQLTAVMISYAEVHLRPAWRRRAMREGVRKVLGLPDSVRWYLDNGAFAFARRGEAVPEAEYVAFVNATRPDWKPVPRDHIPVPHMSPQKQRGCFDRTMRANQAYRHNGFVPVIHVGKHLADYVCALTEDERLSRKRRIAVGALVPNLLRAPKSLPYQHVLSGLLKVRQTFRRKSLHLFGVGGVATLHLAALLEFDSVDSSGWRNRAARGLVLLPGSGERSVAALGSWRSRAPSADEWRVLSACPCPACRAGGLESLAAGGQSGFCHRAAHNLFTLLEELWWIECSLSNGTYQSRWKERLDNSIYRPLIESVVMQRRNSSLSRAAPAQTLVR